MNSNSTPEECYSKLEKLKNIRYWQKYLAIGHTSNMFKKNQSSLSCKKMIMLLCSKLFKLVRFHSCRPFTENGGGSANEGQIVSFV